MARKPMQLKLAHLYPKLMNIYGDRGNILCFLHRCRTRGIDLQVQELEPGDKLNWKDFDILFMGGAQDRQQQRVAEDLVKVKGKPLKEAAEHGTVILAVCGGYQLVGQFYRSADGSELPGAGILDLHTEHPGADAERFIGNVVARWSSGGNGGANSATLVGFENHGGRTFLGGRAQPLAQIVSGYGNNGQDGTEGAVYKNVYGTYLHGSLLPKNPAFADHLIGIALARRYKGARLEAIDDRVEETAHAEAVRLTTGRAIIG
jgi:lipid II isoglutaminyl synthase (glutamine-hydrolysing)